MQIILLEKVVNLGTLGDVVRVKDGYARNFLIPKGKARRATEATIKEFEARRGAKLEGISLPISQKAGVDGRLFGSVTNMDIAAALGKHGFVAVEKAMVRLPNGPLKIIGDHDVSVALHPDVVVAIKVAVSPEV